MEYITKPPHYGEENNEFGAEQTAELGIIST